MFISICTVKVNICNPPLTICGDGVILLKGVEQVLGVAFANVFDHEVFNYKSEKNWAPFVTP